MPKDTPKDIISMHKTLKLGRFKWVTRYMDVSHSFFMPLYKSPHYNQIFIWCNINSQFYKIQRLIRIRHDLPVFVRENNEKYIDIDFCK